MLTTTRRRFASILTAAAAALPFTPVSSMAQTSPSPPPLPTPPTAAAASATSISRALTEVVRSQYGEHLDSGDLQQIEKDFADSVPYVQRLRSFKLVNSDEPDSLFEVR